VEEEGSAAKIVDFILSCRVMGRKVEELMVSTIVQYARGRGLKEVYAEYLPTSKNKPCLEFFQRSRFSERRDSIFVWDLSQDYEAPRHIEVSYSKS
jgi:predicted enzyme involved in methoxymalonyl-ACP biosynthesis